jgi:hypothetical protein
VALAGSLLLLSSVAAASPPGMGQVVAPAAGAVLRAGELTEVRWSPLPAEVEEVELLLSLDGSWGSSLRLTRQLEPGACRFTWSVPNLPTTSARLRLRFGGLGGEELAAAGAPFTIVTARDAPLAGLQLLRSELWVSDVRGLAAVLVGFPEQRLASESEKGQPAPRGLPPGDGFPVTAPGPVGVLVAARRTLAGGRALPSLLRFPLTIPLRQ